MLLHGMSIKMYALIFFSFLCSLDLQSIRDDEATTSMQLICCNALTDLHISSRKKQLKLQNWAKK